MIWDNEVFRCDGNLYVFTRIQNEFTGNISGHFRRIYNDHMGYYAKVDGKNNYISGEVDAFLKREAIQKEAIEFYKKYNRKYYRMNKIKCSYCGCEIKPGNRPTGEPNGVGFQLADGTVISLCYHCICNLPTDTKMHKWLEKFRKGEI